MQRRRIIPHMKAGDRYELMGWACTYLGTDASAGERVHEFRQDEDLRVRRVTDAEVIAYFDAGALRFIGTGPAQTCR